MYTSLLARAFSGYGPMIVRVTKIAGIVLIVIGVLFFLYGIVNYKHKGKRRVGLDGSFVFFVSGVFTLFYPVYLTAAQLLMEV